MPTHAAFLRGVNLAGRRRASAEALRACFDELGFADVATFRTSGNVVFSAGRDTRAGLAERIERGLEQALGYDVAVFLRTEAEIRGIAAHEPFPAEQVEASQGKLQVTMLHTKPRAALRKKVLALATEEDPLAFEGRELYWLPSGMMRDTTLDLKALGKLLGQTTQRTKGTMELLAGKYFGG
jgi:uncharacterized protein (DUF1697 family)